MQATFLLAYPFLARFLRDRMAQRVKDEDLHQIQMCLLGRCHSSFEGTVLTNISSDSPSPLPPPSIEVILHPTWPAVMDCSLDPRLRATGNWTKVTNDTHFLVLLMSAWHTWEYRFYHFLDWDLFLDDLSTGRTDFCSELLVNAVLATASVSNTLSSFRISHQAES